MDLMRPSKDAVRQEFIGTEVTVVSPGVQGPISGRIVDETRNMIRVERDGQEWSIPKRGSSLRLSLEDGEVEIRGDWIVGTPENRIKKKAGRMIT
jgi:ribonuclease P protein subunit POP4